MDNTPWLSYYQVCTQPEQLIVDYESHIHVIKGARGTTELAQELLSSGSHGGMETSAAAQGFSAQIALSVFL